MCNFRYPARYIPFFSLFLILALDSSLAAPRQHGCQGGCRGHGQCQGCCQGNCGGHQHGRRQGPATSGQMQRGPNNPDYQADRDLFHFLLDRGASVKRTVNQLENGVETLTESEEPDVTAAIKKHVRSMKKRLEEGRPIHMRDPLFAALFDHADKIELRFEETEKGAKVTEISADPEVVALIKAHADVVSLFVANGRSEARRSHPVPTAP